VEVAQGGITRRVPEEDVRVAELKAFKTKSGNTRYVLVDDQGREFSTFEEQIAAKLPGLEGKRARVKYHEQQHEGVTNVHLDDVEPLKPAPYLVGQEAELSPRDLFAKLQPFKGLVAGDIERNGDE